MAMYYPRYACIEAVKWTGQNSDEVREFCKGHHIYWDPVWRCLDIDRRTVRIGQYIVRLPGEERLDTWYDDDFEKYWRESNVYYPGHPEWVGGAEHDHVVSHDQNQSRPG